MGRYFPWLPMHNTKCAQKQLTEMSSKCQKKYNYRSIGFERDIAPLICRNNNKKGKNKLIPHTRTILFQ